MPFVVYENRERVFSGDYDTPAWDALKRNRRRTAGFRFHCCDTKVVLFSSRLGRPFFAHAAKHTCEEARNNPESQQHQVLKLAIADMFNTRPGWTADVEVRAPDGSWKADVLAADSEGHRLAIEVQLSQQTDADYLYRTQRYLDAGLLPVWITTRERTELFKTYLIAHAISRSANSVNWKTPAPLTARAITRRLDGPVSNTTIADHLAAVADQVHDWPWDGSSAQPAPLARTFPKLASFWDHERNRGDFTLNDANQNPIAYRYVATPDRQPDKIEIGGRHAWAPLHRAEPGTELAWIITEKTDYQADWVCPNGHRWTETIEQRLEGPWCPECVAAFPATPTCQDGLQPVLRGDREPARPAPRGNVPRLPSNPGLSFLGICLQTANQDLASVCVVGVARVVDGAVEEVTHRFVRPADQYSRIAAGSAQRGVTKDMLDHADGFDTVGPWILRQAGGTPLVGWNTALQMKAFHTAWLSWPDAPRPPDVWHFDIAEPTLTIQGAEVVSRSLVQLTWNLLHSLLSLPDDAAGNAAARARQAANITIALVLQHKVDLADYAQLHTADSQVLVPG